MVDGPPLLVMALDVTRSSLAPRRWEAYPRLQIVGLNDDAIALDGILVAVQVADGVERFAHRHVLEAEGDLAADIRRHQHVVARAGDDGGEHLCRRRVDDIQVEARLRLDRLGHFDRQRRHQGLVGGRIARRSLGRGLSEFLADPFMHGAGAELRRRASGQQRGDARPCHRQIYALHGLFAFSVLPRGRFATLASVGATCLPTPGVRYRVSRPVADRRSTESSPTRSSLASPILPPIST